MEMSNELRNLRPHEVKLLFRIIQQLSTVGDQYTVRKEVSEDLLRLLKSDFVASYVWNQDRQIFEHCVFLNMNPANLARYESYYQFHDPITYSLQKRRRATLVCEVMPQNQLERTEFFNDFLMKDGCRLSTLLTPFPQIKMTPPFTYPSSAYFSIYSCCR